ncbi:MAG: glycosyltransferase family 4 protein [Leadbetterella sp.]
MQKIRVAFFAEILIEEFDGAARTMFQLLRRLPKEQFDFVFFCGEGPDELFGFECIKVPAIPIPINKTYKIAFPFFSKSKLTQKLQAYNPDLVHIATPSFLGKFALNYANKANIPVLSIYHTHFISYIDYYLKSIPFLIKPVKNVVSKYQKSFYNNCNYVLIPSLSISKELENGGVQSEKIIQWERGINLDLFTPKNRNESLRSSWFKNEYPVVLFASRLVWEKNLATLIQIYKLANQENTKLNFLIAGDGVASNEVKKQMPNAKFLGNLSHEQLSEVYASSDIFVFPSISETYGNVVIEAMASGLPCVIANGGGSRDFIEEGKNGFVCDPNQAAEYLAKIKLLIHDSFLRQRITQNGLLYSQQFNWENLIQRYVDLVKKTLV